eukprot:gene16036-17658_t
MADSSSVELVNSEPEDVYVTEETPLIFKPRADASCCSAFYIYALTFFAALGGFLFGYGTGVISGALLPLKREFHLNDLWSELVVSITVGAAIFGSISAGWFSDKFGRKPILIFASSVFTAGSVILTVVKSIEILLVGRATVGLAIGYASCTVPVYIAEASPPNIRGRLVTINQLFITFGQFFASVIDGLFSKNKTNGWRYMLGMAAIPAVIMFFGMIFMPESPRWLVTKDKVEEARKMLLKLRTTEDIEEELDSIVTSWSVDSSSSSNDSGIGILWRILKTSSTRRALVVGCGLQAIQQLCGINTVMYYSATIISMAGVKDEGTAIWLAAVVACGNFIFTLIALVLVERAGRLKLTLCSLFGVIVALCLLASTFILIETRSPSVVMRFPNDTCSVANNCYRCLKDNSCGFCYSSSGASHYSNGSCLSYHDVMPGACQSTHWTTDVCPTSFAWLAVFAMIFYLAAFAPGMGPMPWAINAEIYPLWARSTANSCSTATNWLFNLFVSITFLHLVSLMTEQGAFFLYAGIATAGWIFLALLLPETRGKKLEDVENLFKGPLVARRRKSM